MEEPLIEFYIEKLESSSNKTQVMVEFYRRLFNLSSISQETYKVLGRMISIYGYKIIFLSMLDCMDVENINFDSVFRLVGYFAKKRVAEKFVDNPVENLSSLASKNQKELAKQKKLKIPKVVWEESNDNSV